MGHTAVLIDNVSKLYIIGGGRSSSLQDELAYKWRKIFEQTKISQQEFWALQNISFEVKTGEVTGIVGKNGAGKSTLLKILSRITPPTKGKITINGRVSSLLEVGTGFHPELTGRENIFLNGTILGMSREEIRRKFDEIVDFSGVEKFIDTPVKRYSSGMYVRLAFSVAAHLEPEILIIDEVLAVGDSEFQKKCLGKMKDVSGHGRTVLFVSHNMTAVKSLCSKAAFLKGGKLIDFGDVNYVVNKYLNNELEDHLLSSWNSPEIAPGNELVRVKRVELKPLLHQSGIFVDTDIQIEFDFWNLQHSNSINLSMHVYQASGELIFATASPDFEIGVSLACFKAVIPSNLLNDGVYTISMMIVRNSKEAFTFHDCITFEVKDIERKGGWFGKWPGVVRPSLKWEFSVPHN